MPRGIHIPLDVLLSWPRPNYVDPVTQPKYVLIFSCIIGPISIALLCARLWVRIRMQHNAGWDDWLMLAAALPMLALTIIFPLITEHYQFNRHAWDVEPFLFPLQRKFVMAIYILFSLTSGLLKLSILLFYRRLSSRTVSPAFRWIMRCTIFAIGGYSIAFSIIPIFMCRPIAAFWGQVDFAKAAKGYKYTCINEGVDVVAHGIVSTVQDLVVAFLPTLLCWNLQLPRRQKVALYIIFALGYTSVAIGAIRTYQGYRLFFTTYDVTWVASDIWLWSLLELHIGAMCANAPALKIFFEKVLRVEKLTSWKRSKSRSRSDGSRKADAARSYVTPAMDAGTKNTRWLEKVFRTGRDYSTSNTQLTISGPTNNLSARNSMTKPLVSEHIDTVLTYDGREHDIQLGNLSTHQAPLHENIQALPPVQTPVPLGKRGGRPPPLSQVRTSWTIGGQRYVWRPWERNARTQTHVEHPEWV